MSIEALANRALSSVILPCEHESDKSAWKKISKPNESIHALQEALEHLDIIIAPGNNKTDLLVGID
jgi:hypothetical protein